MILTPAELSFLHSQIATDASALAKDLGVDEHLDGADAVGYGAQSLAARELLVAGDHGLELEPWVAAAGAAIAGPDRSVVIGRADGETIVASRLVDSGAIRLLLTPAPLGCVRVELLDPDADIAEVVASSLGAALEADGSRVVLAVERGVGAPAGIAFERRDQVILWRRSVGDPQIAGDDETGEIGDRGFGDAVAAVLTPAG